MSADILRILVVLIGIGLVAVVLIQQPKEGGMSAFTGGGGGGASGTVFGAKGSGSFLFRLTAGLALAFAVTIGVLVNVTNSEDNSAILAEPDTAVTIPGADNSKMEGTTIPGASSVKTVKESTIPGAATNTATDTKKPTE